jgi:GNAT superfamily N-acetyltransferase
MSDPIIRVLSAAEVEAAAEDLADVLMDCVQGGASVSFMADFTRERALAFWREAADLVAQGRRIFLVARDEAGIVGTVQLAPVTIDNQPHRAEVTKMLVHRRGRRRGIGEALMAAVEAEAVRIGRTLLMLDTVSGDAGDRLYRRCGWIPYGVVPNFALYPDGRLCDATFFYKVMG